MITQKKIRTSLVNPKLRDAELSVTGDPRLEVTYREFQFEQPETVWVDLEFWSELYYYEKQTITDALEFLETFLNVRFREATYINQPDLSLGVADLPDPLPIEGAARWDEGPDGAIENYEMYLVIDGGYDFSQAPFFIVHELLHALGLEHSALKPVLPSEYDTNLYTAMSFNPDPDSDKYLAHPGVFDILALQSIWGAGSHNAKASDYYLDELTEQPLSDYLSYAIIYDTGGNDHIYTSEGQPAYRSTLDIDLRPGYFGELKVASGTSQIGGGTFVIAYGAEIEGATGTEGADTITGNNIDNELFGLEGSDEIRGYNGADLIEGNEGNDWLVGGRGNDILYGGLGQDTLDGGFGKDTLLGGDRADRFVFKPGYGKDRIEDFQSGLDEINLRFWDFNNKREALSFGEQRGDNAVFEFDDGSILRVIDTDLDALKDDLLV